MKKKSRFCFGEQQRDCLFQGNKGLKVKKLGGKKKILESRSRENEEFLAVTGGKRPFVSRK